MVSLWPHVIGHKPSFDFSRSSGLLYICAPHTFQSPFFRSPRLGLASFLFTVCRGGSEHAIVLV